MFVGVDQDESNFLEAVFVFHYFASKHPKKLHHLYIKLYICSTTKGPDQGQGEIIVFMRFA